MGMQSKHRALWIGAVAATALAACAPVYVPPPPPPPPPPTPAWCQSEPAPAPEDHAALVEDDSTGETEVVSFEADTPAEVQAEVAKLEVTGDVVAVEQVQPVQVIAVVPSDDPEYVNQWGFTATEADFPGAWANNFDGTGIRVAVIDTGVQATHPDLDGNVVAGKDFVVPDSASNFGRIDGNGHGTHVAGTVAAEDNTEGVVGGAPGAEVVPVRVLNCQGAGGTDDVAAGILWAIDPLGGDADVINLSLGGVEQSNLMHQAIINAVNQSVVVVASAGNSGFSGSPASYPAAWPEVIAVGAIDSSGARASYSNYNTYIDVAAPGTMIISTLASGSYGNRSGTSMASPHVAALAALLKQQCGVTYTPLQIQARIAATDAAPVSGFDAAVGLMKAGAAITGNPCT